RRNLLRRELLGLIADLHFNVSVAIFAFDDLERHVRRLRIDFSEPASDQTLRGKYSVAGIGNRLPFRGLTDETFASFRESHDGRGGASALRIGDHHWLAALHNRH